MNLIRKWRNPQNAGLLNETKAPTFEELIKQININLRLMGMPFDGTKFHRWFFLPIILLILVACEEIAFFVSKISPENILELTELAPCTAIGILSLVKILFISFKKNKVVGLTKNLEKLYNEIRSDPAKICVIEKDALVLKTLSQYYFVLNAILISIYNFSTVLLMLYQFLTNKAVTFSLPYSVILPFTVDSWMSWLLAYLHLVAGGFICVVYFTTVDVMFITLTSQVCYNFRVLSNELENFAKNEDVSLNKFVKKHQNILKLSNDLEDIFVGPNFFNVVIGSLLICALGFNLTIGFWAQVPGVVVFLSSVLIQILMMSMFGDNLICESQKIADSAYLCKWYEMDVKTRKVLLLIRERARRPQKLTAYKFSIISYSSFTKIISNSWSYFTILRTVYTPREDHS